MSREATLKLLENTDLARCVFNAGGDSAPYARIVFNLLNDELKFHRPPAIGQMLVPFEIACGTVSMPVSYEIDPERLAVDLENRKIPLTLLPRIVKASEAFRRSTGLGIYPVVEKSPLGAASLHLSRAASVLGFQVVVTPENMEEVEKRIAKGKVILPAALDQHPAYI